MSNLITDKPVATTGTIGTLAVALEGYAEYRGWIPAPLAGIALVLTVAVLSTITHALVSPAKKVKDVLERGLQITDADFGRIEAVLSAYGMQVVQKQLDPPVSAAPSPTADTGMGAGAPATPLITDPANMHTDAPTTGA